jgi:hypothetical protein
LPRARLHRVAGLLYAGVSSRHDAVHDEPAALPHGGNRGLFAFVSAFNSLIKRKNRMTVNVRQPAKICRSSLKTGKDLPV